MCTIYYERFCLARFYILACVGVGIHNLKVYLVATWIISCFNEISAIRNDQAIFLSLKIPLARL